MNKKRKKLKGMILNLEEAQLQPWYKIILYSVILEHIYILYLWKSTATPLLAIAHLLGAHHYRCGVQSLALVNCKHWLYLGRNWLTGFPTVMLRMWSASMITGLSPRRAKNPNVFSILHIFLLSLLRDIWVHPR